MASELTAALLGKWLKGDQAAIAFILELWRIVELWDDLIDRDKPAGEAAVNQAFFAALITLPRNVFYRRHFDRLNPLLEGAILDWFTANALETRRDGDDLRIAYVLRGNVQMLLVAAANIVAGPVWAGAVNLELRSVGDRWDDYATQHAHKGAS